MLVRRLIRTIDNGTSPPRDLVRDRIDAGDHIDGVGR